LGNLVTEEENEGEDLNLEMQLLDLWESGRDSVNKEQDRE
jgi:hypothetical protein